MAANGYILLRYIKINSVQKLEQVIKSNTAVFLRIFLRIQRQQENTKENAKKITETTGIDQKRFPD